MHLPDQSYHRYRGDVYTVTVRNKVESGVLAAHISGARFKVGHLLKTTTEHGDDFDITQPEPGLIDVSVTIGPDDDVGPVNTYIFELSLDIEGDPIVSSRGIFIQDSSLTLTLEDDDV